MHISAQRFTETAGVSYRVDKLHLEKKQYAKGMIYFRIFQDKNIE